MLIQKATLDLSSTCNCGSLCQCRAGTGWQVDSIWLASVCILLAYWELPPVVFCALSEVSQAWLLLLRRHSLVFHFCSVTSFLLTHGFSSAFSGAFLVPGSECAHLLFEAENTGQKSWLFSVVITAPLNKTIKCEVLLKKPLGKYSIFPYWWFCQFSGFLKPV